jgi:urea transport system permease protein
VAPDRPVPTAGPGGRGDLTAPVDPARRLRSRDPQLPWIAAFGVVFVVGLPLANALDLLSDYYLNLFGKYLALAILALGMDLIWGYAGILSLGQAIFFGIGAYSIGMYMMLEGSGRGVYGEPIPDFMIWNQVYQLPLFWKPYQHLVIALISSVLLPAALAIVIGLLTFRRKLRGTYFAILTQAIAFAVWLLINRNEMKLGGTNGLTDFKSVFGFSLSDPGVLRALYIVTAALLVGVFLGSRGLVRSKMGLVLEAIRDNERRLEFLGYNVASFKIFVFAVSAALAGLAGLLYAPQVGIITPSQIGVLPSLEVVIWVAFGGRGTLWGAVLGAIAINWLRSVLTATYPTLWPIILGGLFVVVILLFPQGLIGLGARIKGVLAAKRRFVPTPPAAPAAAPSGAKEPTG